MPGVFVAGATGFVGREVVRSASQRELEVHAHVRPDSPRLAEWRNRFEAEGASVDDTAWADEALIESLARIGPDLIFCLIGTTRRRGRLAARSDAKPETYETVDFGLTAMLVEAASAATPHARFVYLSSIGANPESRNAYMRARGRAEAAVTQAGLPYTIVRPSFITGPGRDDSRPGERIGAAVVDGALAGLSLLGARRLRQRYRSITNVDLARRLVDLGLDLAALDTIIEGDQL